jgi:sensor histidine kinase YesM
LESLLLSLPLPMQTVYLLHCCGENIRSSKLFHTVLSLLSVYFVLLVCFPFIDGFIYITPENQYFRDSLYPLPLAPVIAVLLLNLAGTIKRRIQLSRKVFFAFLIAILPITLALILHLFADVFPLIDISYVLSALAMYSFILSDQIEQDRRHQQEIARQQQEIAGQQREIARQQREIAHERASVMVLQMRPHFIYNTLISIYSLCRIDPEKARQVTVNFTNYLRRNFNAVASDSSIPFFTELEHTRAYLAVEQAQFENKLVVDYDTAFTNFRLPPLTLQPIVENAVKHGMDPHSLPLRISIRTRHTNSGTEIIVKDNGRGFNPEDEAEPGTALKNIRQRLEMMCGGSLTITPGEGGGTVVTVTIPDSTMTTT